MSMTAFDTLSASKELQDAGLATTHAEAIAKVIRDGHGDFAVKNDIDQLKNVLKSDIQLLRNELKNDIELLRNEFKNDIELLRNEFKNDIELSENRLKAELTSRIEHSENQLKSGIAQLKTDISWLKWIAGTQIAVVIAAATVVVSILK